MKRAALFFLAAFQAAFVFAVQPGDFFADGDRSKKTVALTFDDGPGHEFTTQILTILDQTKTKATFFMNGDQVEIRPQTAREVHQRGHEIADHTYSHVNFYAYEKKNGPEKTKEKVRDEMRKSQAALEKVLGFRPIFCRMPNGFNRAYVKPVAKEFGYVLVNWTFGEDWLNVPEEKMVQDYIARLKPGAILLFHDGGKNRGKTVRALPKIIEEGRRRGLEFVPVSEIAPSR